MSNLFHADAQQYPNVVVGKNTKPSKGATKSGRGKLAKGPSTNGALTNQSRIKMTRGTKSPSAARRHIQKLVAHYLYSSGMRSVAFKATN